MTSSVIGICNRALSEIGTQSSISTLDEASAEATQCALWYDNQRTGLLRTAPWSFARRQLALTLLGTLEDATSPYPFLYKYAYPSDCIKFRYIIWPPTVDPDAITPPEVGVGPVGPTWWAPSRANRWLIDNDVDADTGEQRKVILTNVPNAIGVYTMDLINPDLFDALFDTALTSALSYKLVIPLSGNVGQRDQFARSAESAIRDARAADGNEGTPRVDHTPDWIAARGTGYQYGFASTAPFWGEWYCSWDNMNWGM